MSHVCIEDQGGCYFCIQEHEENLRKKIRNERWAAQYAERYGNSSSSKEKKIEKTESNKIFSLPETIIQNFRSTYNNCYDPHNDFKKSIKYGSTNEGGSNWSVFYFYTVNLVLILRSPFYHELYLVVSNDGENLSKKLEYHCFNYNEVKTSINLNNFPNNGTLQMVYDNDHTFGNGPLKDQQGFIDGPWWKSLSDLVDLLESINDKCLEERTTKKLADQRLKKDIQKLRIKSWKPS